MWPTNTKRMDEKSERQVSQTGRSYPKYLPMGNETSSLRKLSSRNLAPFALPTFVLCESDLEVRYCEQTTHAKLAIRVCPRRIRVFR